MAEKVDRRVRKTKAQLRAGLARLMQKKSIKEITVKELVEEVDINRSTFYLHYTDFIEQIFTILDHNKDICIALLGKNGDMAFVNRIEKLIADTVLHRLSIRLPKDNRDIEYAYAFCLNGCVGMIKTWLSSENQESTQHMAELTHKLIDNTTHMYLEQALR
ncbi:MAG: TetR/AcrR family transcriptional regulator [Clostridiales bacterium]|nr:TetR/AcrR family transcriptional regulator [Clostridiales bacterium]